MSERNIFVSIAVETSPVNKRTQIFLDDLEKRMEDNTGGYGRAIILLVIMNKANSSTASELSSRIGATPRAPSKRYNSTRT